MTLRKRVGKMQTGHMPPPPPPPFLETAVALAAVAIALVLAVASVKLVAYLRNRREIPGYDRRFRGLKLSAILTLCSVGLVVLCFSAVMLYHTLSSPTRTHDRPSLGVTGRRSACTTDA